MAKVVKRDSFLSDKEETALKIVDQIGSGRVKQLKQKEEEQQDRLDEEDANLDANLTDNVGKTAKH